LRSLSEKLELHPLADHAQDDEDVFGLLEDLQKTVFDYQVCSRLDALSGVNKHNRWYNKRRLMIKDQNGS
jgi:hypothetical protein